MHIHERAARTDSIFVELLAREEVRLSISRYGI